jgi:hypothetical protein
VALRGSAIGSACTHNSLPGSCPPPFPPISQQADTLRGNWYETAADLAAMSPADAAALGVPLRLLSHAARALRGGAGSSEDEGGGGEAAPAGGGGGGGAADALPADIMQRRAPPRRAAFSQRRAAPKVTKRTRLPPYGLTVRRGRERTRGAGCTVRGRSGAPGPAACRPPASGAAPLIGAPAPTGRRPDAGAAAGAGGAGPQPRPPQSQPLPPPLSSPPFPHQQDADLTPALREELAALEAFSTGRFFGQRVEPIGAATHTADVQRIK